MGSLIAYGIIESACLWASGAAAKPCTIKSDNVARPYEGSIPERVGRFFFTQITGTLKLHATISKATVPQYYLHEKVFCGFDFHRSTQNVQDDRCGVRTHALTDWRLKPAP